MKKNNIWISFGLFLLVVLGVSCKKDKASDYKMISQGPVGEIMLVIENKKLDADLGKTVKEILQTNYPGIPELVAESYFKVETMPPQNFKGYAKRHRSILQINIAENVKNRVFQKDDIFAFEQKYMLVEAQNDAEAIRLLTVHKQQILDYFEEGEITHFTKLYMQESSDFSDKLSKTMGVWLSAPEYSVKRMEKEFAWASRETKRTSQAIMVYELPYTSATEQLSKEGLIAIKDKFLKKYVEGLDEGTFMRTETEQAEVVQKVVNLNGYYAVELRGYWTLEGGFMGGPFLLIALVDEPNNRLLILDSYVFAPEAKYSKVKFIREIEGIFRTLKMTAKK